MIWPSKNFYRSARVFLGILVTSTVSVASECELLPATNSPHEVPGLSTFWAQEYTGSDLLRTKLEALQLTASSDLIAILDSFQGDHGEKVANLIASPFRAAPIPYKFQLPFSNVEKEVRNFDPYTAFCSGCDEAVQYPGYINNSMGWGNSEVVYAAVEQLTGHGSVFVTAAGNEREFMEPRKVEASRNLGVIAVASLEQNGTPSKFSNFSQEIAISAPSHTLITSFDHNGYARRFGGTSGATPQVTAALAAFTLISGHQLTGQQAKLLLRETAITVPHSLLGRQVLGAGSLNTYAIGEVAARLGKVCSEQEKPAHCFDEKFLDPQTYQFPEDNLESARAHFPKCFGRSADPVSTECRTLKGSLDDLRKSALRSRNNPELWRAIGCIHQQYGLERNAEFYQTISESLQVAESGLESPFFLQDIYRLGVPSFFAGLVPQRHAGLVHQILDKSRVYDSDIAEFTLAGTGWENHPDIAQRLLERNQTYRLIRDVFSKNHWVHHTGLLAGLIKDGDWDEQIAKYIFSKPHWAQHPDLLEVLIRNRNADREIAKSVLSHGFWSAHPDLVALLIEERTADLDVIRHVLSQPHWSDHPELVKRLIEKGASRVLIKIHLMRKPHWSENQELRALLGE